MSADTHAIIEADFATWRPVQGRKVLQLILEVPIERTHEVLQKLGAPIAGQSKWVAIALLKDKPDPSSSEPKVSGSPKRKFSDMPLSQQAALRCNESDFRLWLGLQYPAYIGCDDMAAAAFIRGHCDVSSRSEIIEGTKAADKWLSFDGEYQKWLTDQRFAGARR